MAAEKHAPDTCPRCGQLFICRVNSALKCDCFDLHLTPAELRYIREYTDLTFGAYTCLCVSCLRELKTEQLANLPITDL